MTLDPKSAARRLIIERIILAGFGAVLIGIMVAAKVAWGQGVDPAPAHPVDWLSAAVGGGGMTGIGVLVLGLFALGKRLGLSMPRIVIGDAEKAPTVAEESSSTIRESPLSVELERRLDRVEVEQTRNREAMVRLEANQTRALLEVKELRDLAQQILLRFMERGGSRG